MIIDENGKLFRKVSIIDILIVLVILLCIAGAVIRFSGLLGDNGSAPALNRVCAAGSANPR